MDEVSNGDPSKAPQKKLDKLLKIPVIRGIIKKKILKGLGLEKARIAATGAAPISLPLLNGGSLLGLTILEGYGMTEKLCLFSLKPTKPRTICYVGQAMPGVDVRLSEEGEIQIKNDCLMNGYYKEPELTAETFADGYLRTGDQGSIDENGYLKITGRVKDLFKTGKGKYVVPSPIELKISKSQLIEQVCVTGNGLPQPIALINLSEDGKKLPQKEVENTLIASLKKLITLLINMKGTEKLIVLKDDWTVENNVLTPTMKIKRNVVEKTYQEKYESWFEAPNKVIWSESSFFQ